MILAQIPYEMDGGSPGADNLDLDLGSSDLQRKQSVEFIDIQYH